MTTHLGGRPPSVPVLGGRTSIGNGSSMSWIDLGGQREEGPQPSAAILDADWRKRQNEAHGCDGAKKLNGHKRHLPVEAEGLVLNAAMYPAQVVDWNDARPGPEGITTYVPQHRHQWRDDGYAGGRSRHLRGVQVHRAGGTQHPPLILMHLSSRSPAAEGLLGIDSLLGGGRHISLARTLGAAEYGQREAARHRGGLDLPRHGQFARSIGPIP